MIGKRHIGLLKLFSAIEHSPLVSDVRLTGAYKFPWKHSFKTSLENIKSVEKRAKCLFAEYGDDSVWNWFYGCYRFTVTCFNGSWCSRGKQIQ